MRWTVTRCGGRSSRPPSSTDGEPLGDPPSCSAWNEETGASVPDMSSAWLGGPGGLRHGGVLRPGARRSTARWTWRPARPAAGGAQLTERAVRWLLRNRRPPFRHPGHDRLPADRFHWWRPARPCCRPGGTWPGSGSGRTPSGPAVPRRSWRSGWPRWSPLLGLRRGGDRRHAPAGRSRRPPRSARRRRPAADHQAPRPDRGPATRRQVEHAGPRRARDDLYSATAALAAGRAHGDRGRALPSSGWRSG